MSKIPTIKRDTFKEAPFSQEEQELLTIACKNPRDRAIIEFLLSTGCRVSETVGANRNQIDYTTKQLKVIGKGNKQRTVYLTDKALVYLKIYLDNRTDDNPALFVTRVKPYRRMSVDAVEGMLKQIGEIAGVTNVHPHRFRRTLCNTLLERGMNIQDVKEILGHSSITTTLIYSNANQTAIKHNFMSLM